MKKFFKLKENYTNICAKMMAGLMTFFVRSHILFVNLSLLGAAGIPRQAAFLATIVKWINFQTRNRKDADSTCFSLSMSREVESDHVAKLIQKTVKQALKSTPHFLLQAYLAFFLRYEG